MPKSYLSHQDFFESVFSSAPSSVLSHYSGICLHVNFEKLTDIGTLPAACLEVPKYFPIDDESIILLNDPYCGGGVLSSFTLLMGLNINTVPKTGSEFLLGIKFHVRPNLIFADSVDEEGLKVPPTPIFDKVNGLNTQIIGAIENAPLAPENFSIHLSTALDKLKSLRDKLLSSQKLWSIDLKQKALQKYIKQSHEKMIDHLTGLKQSSAKLKESWVSGESIKLEILKDDEKLNLIFSDVSGSKLYNLSEAATFGVCFGAIQNALQTKIPLNSGSLECIRVKIPQNCFLNARPPAPVYLGFSEASGLIANLICKTLGKMNSQLQSAEGNSGCVSVNLKFDAGEHFFDRLPSGQGASRNQNGASVVDKWTHHDLQASIEDIELRFPMQIRSTSIRPGSGGSGTHSGGEGMIRSYSIKAPAQFTWFTAQSSHSPDGFKGGSSGLSTQFILIRDSKRSKLDAHGSMKLRPEDRIDVLTAGGGGFDDEDSI